MNKVKINKEVFIRKECIFALAICVLRKIDNRFMNNIEKESHNEVELNYFFDRIGKVLNRIAFGIFIMVKKNFLILIALLIVGGGLGFFLDKRGESNLKHDILLIPNFNSVNYLYDKVKNRDYQNHKLFHKQIMNVGVEPIDNLYDFLIEDKVNLRVFDAINKNNTLDLEKFAKQNSTKINFKYHLLTVYTNNVSKDSVNDLLNKYLEDLNSDHYYNERRKVEYVNTLKEKEEIVKSIKQINTFFDNIGYANVSTNANVSLNTFNQINDMLYTKENFLKESNLLDVRLIEQSKVFYESYRVINIPNSKFPFTLVLPIFFVFVFCVYLFIKNKISEFKLIENKQD